MSGGKTRDGRDGELFEHCELNAMREKESKDVNGGSSSGSVSDYVLNALLLSGGSRVISTTVSMLHSHKRSFPVSSLLVSPSPAQAHLEPTVPASYVQDPCPPIRPPNAV